MANVGILEVLHSAFTCLTQNLQNVDICHSQPQGRQNTTDAVSLHLFWSIYKHSAQYFDLNMNLRISSYKSFIIQHTDCLGGLCSHKILSLRVQVGGEHPRPQGYPVFLNVQMDWRLWGRGWGARVYLLPVR